MTCIVGVVANNKVFIGGDTQGTDDRYAKDVRRDVKVFRNGDFVIGFSGSYRVGQILRYCLDMRLEISEQEKINNDFMSYMCCDFISHIRDALEKNFYTKLKEEKNLWEMSILVGYKNKLVQISEDFQVQECVNPFDAIGCGDLLAKGILYDMMMEGRLKGKDSNIELQIRKTIEYVGRMSAGVGGDITLLTT